MIVGRVRCPRDVSNLSSAVYAYPRHGRARAAGVLKRGLLYCHCRGSHLTSLHRGPVDAHVDAQVAGLGSGREAWNFEREVVGRTTADVSRRRCGRAGAFSPSGSRRAAFSFHPSRTRTLASRSTAPRSRPSLLASTSRLRGVDGFVGLRTWGSTRSLRHDLPPRCAFRSS